MPNRELKTVKSLKQSIAPLSISADTNGSDVNVGGFDAVTVEINVGLGTGLSGSAYFEFELQHADDDGAGSPDTYSAVANADLTDYVTGTNTGTICKVDDAAEDNLIYTSGYIGMKEWVRVVANETGAVTSLVCAATIIREKPNLAPTTNN